MKNLTIIKKIKKNFVSYKITKSNANLKEMGQPFETLITN